MQTRIETRAFRAILLLLIAFVCACLLSTTPPAFAETSIEKQAEADQTANMIDTLQTNLNGANATYADATDQYNQAKAAAEAAAQRVDEAKARIVELQGHLSTRVQSMYRSGGQSSFLDVLLDATSFDQFLTTWNAVEKITGQDAALVQESKDARSEAQAAQAEYEQQTVRAEQQMKAAQTARDEIASTKSSMEALLAQQTEEVAQLQMREESERMEAEQAQQRLAAAQQAASGISGGGEDYPSGGGGSATISGWVNPLPGYYGVTNEFGWAGSWDGAYHNGIDLGASEGTPIYAAGPGTVTYAGWYGTGGNAIKINHGNGIVTIYMHQSSFAASVGQQVNAGDLIGYVGMTGYTTGPHLHFQIEVNGTPVNPRNYYSF